MNSCYGSSKISITTWIVSWDAQYRRVGAGIHFAVKFLGNLFVIFSDGGQIEIPPNIFVPNKPGHSCDPPDCDFLNAFEAENTFVGRRQPNGASIANKWTQHGLI
ncbi:hypothetical protein AVEN_183070-1 [Araneus ventricosus]|uniref:Uncharacterized protein n=1 Tax=Araneus ventricosus TaxID=182803 RepID=A0A4Y2MGZ0_ARAVE|nr:hypothetical protein AVEN_183070-1 [Araneus ventricosus]